MPHDTYVVHGDGRIGTALAGRLADLGAAVTVRGPSTTYRDGSRRGDPVTVAIVCVPSGAEARDVVDAVCARKERPRAVLDLTTQGVDTASASRQRCEEAGVSYAAGGVLGGQAQVRRGDAAVVLGPRGFAPGGAFERAWAKMHVVVDLAEAVRYKLLHNYVSLRAQVAVAEALSAMGVVSAGEFAGVLAFGPAGRQLPDTSVVRDWDGQAVTSYTAGLVRKDLDLIGAEFPALGRACRETAARLHGSDDSPFTTALRQGAGSHA